MAGFYRSVLAPCIEMIWFAHVTAATVFCELSDPSSPLKSEWLVGFSDPSLLKAIGRYNL
jgi:hypothetical protein